MITEERTMQFQYVVQSQGFLVLSLTLASGEDALGQQARHLDILLEGTNLVKPEANTIMLTVIL